MKKAGVESNAIKMEHNKIMHDKIDIINEEGIEYLKKNKKRNIYYVIVDAAIPLDKFDKHYNTNYFLSYKSKFAKLGFDYVQTTNSAYMDTNNNLTSLFFMDYHIGFIFHDHSS